MKSSVAHWGPREWRRNLDDLVPDPAHPQALLACSRASERKSSGSPVMMMPPPGRIAVATTFAAAVRAFSASILASLTLNLAT